MGEGHEPEPGPGTRVVCGTAGRFGNSGGEPGYPWKGRKWEADWDHLVASALMQGSQLQVGFAVLGLRPRARAALRFISVH